MGPKIYASRLWDQKSMRAVFITMKLSELDHIDFWFRILFRQIIVYMSSIYVSRLWDQKYM